MLAFCKYKNNKMRKEREKEEKTIASDRDKLLGLPKLNTESTFHVFLA